jgi:hypothetical protein
MTNVTTIKKTKQMIEDFNKLADALGLEERSDEVVEAGFVDLRDEIERALREKKNHIDLVEMKFKTLNEMIGEFDDMDPRLKYRRMVEIFRELHIPRA